MVQFDEYFDQLTHKLSERGFSVSRNVDSGGTHLDLIATRSAVELTKMGIMSRFMIASSMDHVDKKVIGQYIIHSVNYAINNEKSLLPHGVGSSALILPVILSEQFSEEDELWVTKTIPKKHWGVFEFPVFVSLNNRQIFYCKKTPVWGAAYYKGFREFAEQELGFH